MSNSWGGRTRQKEGEVSAVPEKPSRHFSKEKKASFFGSYSLGNTSSKAMPNIDTSKKRANYLTDQAASDLYQKALNYYDQATPVSFEQALQCFKIILNMSGQKLSNPEKARILLYCGMAAFSLNNEKEALGYFNESLKINPTDEALRNKALRLKKEMEERLSPALPLMRMPGL